jgi:hypothetical protein
VENLALLRWISLLNLNLSHRKFISLGRGSFDFQFSSPEDNRKVLPVGAWNLKPGIVSGKVMFRITFISRIYLRNIGNLKHCLK